MSIFNGESFKADKKEAIETNKEYDEKMEVVRKSIRELALTVMHNKLEMDEETAKKKIKDMIDEELDHLSFFS